MEQDKLATAQAAATAYIEAHQLGSLLKQMLNALVRAKDPQPEAFMIRYLLTEGGLSPEELEAIYQAPEEAQLNEESKESSEAPNESKVIKPSLRANRYESQAPPETEYYSYGNYSQSRFTSGKHWN